MYDIPNTINTNDDILSAPLKGNFDYIENALNDFDGGNITAATIPDDAFVTSPETIRDETLPDHVVSGLTSADPGATLTATVASGLAYIEGVRVNASSFNHTYTASKDCYVDLDKNGSFHVTEVANGATEPALYTNSTRICKFVTDGTEITSYSDLRTLNNFFSGRWLAWTPTFTNLTVGAGGTLNAKYTQIGKTIHFSLYWKFGTGSAVSGSISFSLPITSVSKVALESIGTGGEKDHNTGVVYPTSVLWRTTTTASIHFSKSDGTYTALSDSSSTAPFTWATNDTISVVGTYEAA
jgi:hypothetical protein